MTIRLRQELATLQRQVNGLTISMQTPHPPSTYQAHPTHATTSDRNVSRSPSNSGRDYTGAEPPGHPANEPIGSITALPTIERDDPYETSGITNDHAAIEPENETEEVVNDEDNVLEENGIVKDYHEPEYEQKEKIPEEHTNQTIRQEAEKPMEVEPTPEYETQNYPYEQNYEQTHETVDPQYQNQYEQNYEQPYTEQQQYENYEQYPQQYTDPNAQYDQQYENYSTDPNYQGEQNFDTTQYAQEYQSDQNPTQYQEGSADQDDSKTHEEGYNTAQYTQEYQGDQNTTQAKREKVLEQNGSKKTQNDKLPSQS